MKHATNVVTSAGTEPCLPPAPPRTRASVLCQDDTLLFPDHPAFSSAPGNRYTGWVLGQHHLPLIYGTDQAKAKAKAKKKALNFNLFGHRRLLSAGSSEGTVSLSLFNLTPVC